VLVHDCTLTSTNLVEEPFLRQGQGSAFVSRPNELVVVTLTASGLPGIQAKITQLVEKGFHSIVVSFNGLKTLERDALKLLLKARAYVENWAGFMRVCDVGPELMTLMGALGLDKDLAPQGTRDDAIAAWKRELQGGPAVEPSPTPAPNNNKKKADSTFVDLGMEMPKPGPGKTSLDLQLEMPKASSGEGNLPSVEISEVVVPAEDLPKLKKQIEGILARGKRYVTMRLSFKKRMRSEDVQLLTEARDLLLQQGGQLVLASLQADVATWLKLLDYDREFVIAEDADQAELAHRKHAAGGKPATAQAPKKPTGKTGVIAAIPAPMPTKGALSIASRSDSAVVVKCGPGSKRTKAPVAVVAVDRASVPQILAEVERLSASGARDLVVDLSAVAQPKGERMDVLGEAATLAQMKGVRLSFARVSRELRSFLKLLGLEGKLALFEDMDGAFLKHAEQLAALAPTDEIELALTRSALGAGSSNALAEETRALEQPRVSAAENELRAELQRAQTRTRELEKALEQARNQPAKVVEKIVPQIVEKVVEKVVEKRVEVPKVIEKIVEKIVEKRVEVPKADHEALNAKDRELTQARATAEKTQQELAKTKERLDFVEARYREADYARNELNAIARSSDDARKKFQSEIEAAESRVRAAETAAKAKESELNAQARTLAARVKDLEQQVAQKPRAASTGGDSDRVQKLEREKAEILLESKREIERLTREQETLREELESAGEMIERLGKELELT
jgi:anti-anti-sigma regulatory factor